MTDSYNKICNKNFTTKNPREKVCFVKSTYPCPDKYYIQLFIQIFNYFCEESCSGGIFWPQPVIVLK